ncbi:hypothetical protein AC579_6313 [Pseudocercospora musae]|uniref:Rhodopsin domain-containing protein n=1 Tax=Pseudocercospora musae TaxID=113226 RepID=A0A139IP52_9PEZI|nr:hypothetical protein AC579_6313 [Pseudocercospora musae]
MHRAPTLKPLQIAQCIRVFESVRKFCYVAWFLGLVVTGYTITTCFVTLFMCKPISYFWHPDRTGHCLTARPIWFFNTAFSIATDIAVALLPLPVVNTLHLPRRQKRMLMAVFALGGSVCLISLIRLYSLYAVTHNHDDTWEDPQASVYSSIETLVAIIAGCLPTYNAFLAKHFPRLHRRYAMHRNVDPVLPFLDIDAAFPVQERAPRTESVSKDVVTVASVSKDVVTVASVSADEHTMKSGHLSQETTVDLTLAQNETDRVSFLEEIRSRLRKGMA